MGVLTYRSNNSGGGWWLNTQDWESLEEAGWICHWIHDPKDSDHTHEEEQEESWMEHRHSYSDPLVKATRSGKDFLGALALSAAIETDDPDAVIREFELVTGQSADDPGCNCCGPPHSFTFRDKEGKSHYLDSSPSEYSRSWS